MWAIPAGWPYSPFEGLALITGLIPETSLAPFSSSFHPFLLTPASPHLVLTLNLKPLSGQVLWHQRVHNAVLLLLCQCRECTSICPWGPKEGGSDKRPENANEHLASRLTLASLSFYVPSFLTCFGDTLPSFVSEEVVKNKHNCSLLNRGAPSSSLETILPSH